MKYPKVVFARWIDPFSIHGWSTRESLAREIAATAGREAVTVGFLVHKDEASIGLAESISPTGEIGCVTWIPRRALICWETLRKASKEDE